MLAPPSRGGYEPHIDGLRAIAVLAVILFHYDVSWLEGGFVGVDIFFVISGYLITSHLAAELSGTGELRLRRFYLRRIRRLFPALLVTVLLSTVAACWLLSPPLLRDYAWSALAALFSFANVYFWSVSGYFEADALTQPLLHTWSLGVEEQFYLFWPVFLLLWSRWQGRERLYQGVALMLVASFALNLLWVWGKFDPEYHSSLFYLPFFRVFELALGAMVVPLRRAWRPGLPGQELAFWLGLGLVLASLCLISEESIFPAWWALLPCVGSLLVIFSNGAYSARLVLGNPLGTGLGKLSYSLYLVHWPLLVFYQYYRFADLSVTEYAGLFGATLALAWFLYRTVEMPLRVGTGEAFEFSNKVFARVVLPPLVMVSAAVAVTGFRDGRILETSGSLLSAEQIRSGETARFSLVRRACRIDFAGQDDWRCQDARPFQLLVFGNSHEPDVYNALSRYYRGNDAVNLVSFGTTNGCELSFENGQPQSLVNSRNCRERVERLSDADFVNGLTAVLYNANQPFSREREAEWHALGYLQRLNPELVVIVFGGYINTRHHCSELYNRYLSYDVCRQSRFVEYDPTLERPQPPIPEASRPAFQFFAKAELLCSGALSRCEVELGGQPAFYDNHHLSFPFATRWGLLMLEHWHDRLSAAGAPVGVPSTLSARVD